MSMHIGIIGGMGTEAGLATAQIICDAFRAKNLTYPKLTLISDETIPDRSEFLMGKSEKNPAKKISLIGNQLLSLGVDCIIIACFTAHSPTIIDRIDGNVKARLFSLFSPLRHLSQTKRKVGILATIGSQKSAVFDYHLPFCEIVYPKSSDQQTLMRSIYDIKSRGVNPKAVEDIILVASNLAKNVDFLILGCTELLLLDFPPSMEVINPVKILGVHLCQLSQNKANAFEYLL